MNILNKGKSRLFLHTLWANLKHRWNLPKSSWSPWSTHPQVCKHNYNVCIYIYICTMYIYIYTIYKYMRLHNMSKYHVCIYMSHLHIFFFQKERNAQHLPPSRPGRAPSPGRSARSRGAPTRRRRRTSGSPGRGKGLRAALLLPRRLKGPPRGLSKIGEDWTPQKMQRVLWLPLGFPLKQCLRPWSIRRGFQTFWHQKGLLWLGAIRSPAQSRPSSL